VKQKLKRLNAAVVGCGRIGCTYGIESGKILSHCRAYSKHSQFDLVAVCDRAKEKAEKCGKKYNAKVYTDFSEMLKKEKIDILSVCTNTESHYGIVSEAINKNVKAIFCEKPFGYSSSQAEELSKKCEKKKILLAVNYSRRWNKNYQRLQKFFANGGIGELQHISFDYCKGIFNNGSHAIDLIYWFLGSPKKIIAKKARTVFGSDPDINAMLFFDNGSSASLNSLDYRKYNIFQFSVFGSTGMARIKDNSGLFQISLAHKDKDFFHKTLGKEKILFKKIEGNSLMNALGDIVSCVRGNGKTKSNAENAINVLKIIEASNMASELDCRNLMRTKLF
jgi:predicted dehydrogenase